MLVEIVKIAALALCGLALFLYFYQERMLFYPSAAPAILPKPAHGTLKTLSLRTAEGLRITAWLVGSGQRGPVVFYFGGNAEDVSWLIGMNDRFPGYSLLLVNYRGYGPSEGRPGESSLFADALAWYDHLARRSDVDIRSSIVMGRSLGSGVAVYLAANRALAGVILVSPYDSVRSLAKSIYPYLPIAILLKHPFDSLSRAQGITAPLLCLVAREDRVVSPENSRRLFDKWGTKSKLWRALPGDHDSISDQSAYWDEVAAYLEGKMAP